MADVNTSVGTTGTGTSLTTGNAAVGGANRAVYATACSDTSYASDAKYGGSGGTSMPQVSSNQALAFFSGGWFNGWGAAGSSSGSVAGYASWGSTNQGSATTAFAFLENVDQVTPFGSETTSGDLDAPVTSMVASISRTGLTPGQLVVAGLGVLTFQDISVVADNGATNVIAFQQGGGGTKDSTAILWGYADGSGAITLAAEVSQATGDLIAWCLSSLPVNGAGGGPAVVAGSLVDAIRLKSKLRGLVQ